MRGGEHAVVGGDRASGRRKQLHPPDDGARPDDEAVPDVAGQRNRIDLPFEHLAGEQGADLGGEEDRARPSGPGDAAQVEGLDAEAVASEEHRPLRCIPQGKGEHPSQSRDAVRAPARIRLEDDLRVAARAEPGALALQLPAQRLEVVDLPIEDDDVAGFRVRHGLAAVLAQVDDREPAVREDDPGPAIPRAGHPEAARIGSAVPLRSAHAMDGLDDRAVDRSDGPRDSTHI